MRTVNSDACIKLDQERHISQLAADYGVLDHKSVLTHMVVLANLQKSPDLPQAAIPFKQLVGLLLCIARHTHPAVMQPVAYLAQFCTCHARNHFLAGLSVLKYLNTVKD